ncbi:MAG: hypothetical protein H0V23_00020 [Nocardioidaceae bacterium]|nr:hypothetical protein [Nocardioidaceae bacterium]
MSLSDHTLRRAAWACWWFLVVVLIIGLPIALSDGPAPQGTWGASGDVLEIAFNLVVLVFPLTGLLILIRQPQNTIGWVLQGIGVTWGVGSLLDSYATYGLVLNPGSLPGADVAAALNEGTWAPWIGLMGIFLILLFPDGRLPSPRWRPVAWLSAVTIVAVTVVIGLEPGLLEEGPVPDMTNPIGLEAAQLPLLVLLAIFLPLLPLCIVASAVALVLRFRRSHGFERQQIKWLATAGSLVAVLYLVTMASTLATSSMDRIPSWVLGLQNAATLSFVLLPVAIGLAILRYRLYDIDVVINRALVYGSLTAMLAGVYLGSVLLLQVVLNPITDQSDLAVAGSTLAVAALFRPARGRIQSIVDRRFYRNRYDAARTLDAFAGRLRQELDLDAVGTDLRTTARETVQPSHVSLWLRG